MQDVTIQNNVFEECGYVSAPHSYVISIAPENHQLVPNFYVHQNIRIENNTFRVSDVPLLAAKSVDGLTFRGNRVEPGTLVGASTLGASTLGASTLGASTPGTSSTKKPFLLTACRNAVIRQNQFTTPWKPLIEQIQMPDRSLKTDLRN